MTVLEREAVLKMPVEQRILLVEDMWDSIRPQSERLPVPESHKRELDRRIEKVKHDPSALLDDRQLRKALGSRGV
jgi:putative addiction module component (TIGR02574 family)